MRWKGLLKFDLSKICGCTCLCPSTCAFACASCTCEFKICLCMSVHVQLMSSWIGQGDENVCMWMYKHLCMCIRTCMCKSGQVQIIVSWISQQQSICSHQTCDSVQLSSKLKTQRSAGLAANDTCRARKFLIIPMSKRPAPSNRVL